MRRRWLYFSVLVLGLAVLGLAQVPCPPGKVAVTFKYVPLPDEEVHSVSLRGTFNDWGEWLMERQPGGTWAITVCLAPGEYQYKYFINGKWVKDMSTDRGGGPVDPDADGYADDGFGGKNAIRRVGQFIKGTWDFKTRLIPSPLIDHNHLTLDYYVGGYKISSLSKFGWGGDFEEQGFELSGLAFGIVDLKGGMYFDPTAVAYKHTFFQAKANVAGFDLTGKVEHWHEPYLPSDRCPVPVTFRYVPAPGETVTSVNVAGDFDDWNPSDPDTAMSYDPATGEWSVTLYLTPGPHQYKYVINGSWPGNMQTDHPVTGGPVDPDLPTDPSVAYLYYVDDGFGGKNAVRVIRATCPRADTVPVVFRYVPATGETVTSVNVAGDFDGWNPSDSDTAMSYDPTTGEWSVTLYLTPGPHQYKYVINGSWPGNMQTDHPVTGGPVDPDADGYYYGNAVRLIGDPMPSYMRYTFNLKFGNFEGTIRFEDCCCGIMFKDLTLSAKGLSLCCGITYDATLSFTKHGFDYLKLSVPKLFSPCCDISMGFDVEFGTDYKKISPTFSWGGIQGCLTLYGDVVVSDTSIQGLTLYGFKLHCDLTPCGFLEVLTALNVDKIEEIFKADIFKDDEFEYVKLGFCGKACCGGNWDLTVTTFFAHSGSLFGIKRIWVDVNVPLTDNLKLVLNVSPTIPEAYFGWVLKF